MGNAALDLLVRLIRWFMGLSIDHSVWAQWCFSKNRERLIRHDAVTESFNEVLPSEPTFDDLFVTLNRNRS